MKTQTHYVSRSFFVLFPDASLPCLYPCLYLRKGWSRMLEQAWEALFLPVPSQAQARGP